MNNGLARIKEFVSNHRHPSAAEFIKTDAPGFEGLTELLSRLLERPITVSPHDHVVEFFVPEASTPLLFVGGPVPTLVGDPDIVRRLNGLLGAARIHFVESFDWVNFPGPTRARLVSQEAADLSLTEVEFSKFTHKWVS